MAVVKWLFNVIVMLVDKEPWRQNWENTGLGVNPDGSQANMGVHGGPNNWE